MSPWESHFGKTTALLLPDAVDASPFLSEDTMNVQRAVHGAVAEAVSVAVYDAVDEAVSGAVSDAVDGVVRGAVHGVVSVAVAGRVYEAIRDDIDALCGEDG